MNQNNGYSTELKTRLEWNISPFKGKDVVEFVPSGKWSTEDHTSDDFHTEFRPRLHSSPYVDENFIGRFRSIKKENQRPQPVPFLSIDDDCCHPAASPRLSSYKARECKRQFVDSGIDSITSLQQTRFYDNLSSSSYSADSGISSSLSSGATCSFHQSTDITQQINSNKRFEEAKYAFDPLAPPFKPRTAMSKSPELRFDKSDVMAIDVANYVSSRYNESAVCRDNRFAFSDVTNLQSDIDKTKIPNLMINSSPSLIDTSGNLTSIVDKVSTGSRDEVTCRSKSSVVPYDVDRSSGKENMVRNDIQPSASTMLGIPNPITNSIKNSPLTKAWISSKFEEHSEAKEIVPKARTQFSTNPVNNAGGFDPYVESATISNPFDIDFGYTADKIASGLNSRDIPGNTSTNTKSFASSIEAQNPNSKWRVNQNLLADTTADHSVTEESSQKKVTFADIVQAGIRAINRRKVENPNFYDPANIYQSAVNVNPIESSIPTTVIDSGISMNDIFINNERLETDEFESHKPSKYRTEPCTTFHTIGVCPYGTRCNFYHTDAERNEIPTLSNAMRYKTRLCKTWQRAGECPYGNKCDFAHGTDDLTSNSPYKPHYKTRMCKVLQQTGRCPYGAQCTFAHKQAELRTDISMIYKYKTEICKSWAMGLECSHGTDCHFAHGEKELKSESELFGR